MFNGFQTASGKPVHFSEKSLQYARNLLESVGVSSPVIKKTFGEISSVSNPNPEDDDFEPAEKRVRLEDEENQENKKPSDEFIDKEIMDSTIALLADEELEKIKSDTTASKEPIEIAATASPVLRYVTRPSKASKEREASRRELDFNCESRFPDYTHLAKVTVAVSQARIQKPAPFFKGTAVVDGVFQDISLEDYKGKYVVLFFYPADFTFVCPTEIIAFSDRAEDFRKIGCEVIAASTDSHFSHFAWVNTPRNVGGLGKMEIPLLADKTGEIARKYGIYKEDEGIAFRGLFIIDGKQNLRQITVNDLPVGRNVDETLRLVQAFQFADEHGEVCPANWKPGEKTIKPTMEDSKDFFKNGEDKGGDK